MESPPPPPPPPNNHQRLPKDEISYPATRMMSIADLLEFNLLEGQAKAFKTPAERKEMPATPVDYSIPSVTRARNAAAITPAPILPPGPFNFANPTFPGPAVIHYPRVNTMAPPYYDMRYYAPPPIAYGALPQMNFNAGPPMVPFNPLMAPNVAFIKPPHTFQVPDVEKILAQKEKKRRAMLKRAAKFHPYGNN